MKTIQLHFSFSDKLELKKIIFQYNNTGLESNKELLKSIANVIIESIECEKRGVKEDLTSYLRTEKDSDKAGEFALPTNNYLMKLSLIGRLLQDEKARTHLAFGYPDPSKTGADWGEELGTHVDGIMKNCSIWVDGRQIMKGDEYLFEF